MKVSGFWALFMVVGTILIFFNFSSSIAGSWFPGNFIYNNVSQHGWPFFLISNALIGLASHLALTPLFLNVILDLVCTNCGDSTTMIAVSRKLKENSSGIRSNKKGDIGHVTLDDYQPIDPVPSSKASVKPGPIEHGSPLIPFIPKPSPPAPPKAGGST